MVETGIWQALRTEKMEVLMQRENIYKLPLVLEPQPEGGYTVTCPLLPTLITEADTLDEVIPHVADALAALIEAYEDLGHPLPAALQPLRPDLPLWAETLVPVVAGSTKKWSKSGKSLVVRKSPVEVEVPIGKGVEDRDPTSHHPATGFRLGEVQPNVAAREAYSHTGGAVEGPHSALAYYFDHQEEIDRDLAESSDEAYGKQHVIPHPKARIGALGKGDPIWGPSKWR